jgi:hypothetical protein
MKTDLTTTFLNFLLAVLVILSVGFALLTVLREPKVPILAAQAVQDNNSKMKLTALLNDAAAYNNTVHSPVLARILQSVEAKPATAH